MPAMLTLYIIPVVMIPVVPLVCFIAYAEETAHFVLAFAIISGGIAVACWTQYRAGKREWHSAHPEGRWILTHRTLGLSLIWFSLAVMLFVFSIPLEGGGVLPGLFCLGFSLAFARGYKKYRKSPKAYKKWEAEQRQNRHFRALDPHMTSASADTAGGVGTARYTGIGRN